MLTATVVLLVALVHATVITWRALDIDDVILNTSSALTSCLPLGRRLGRAARPHRRFRNRRDSHETCAEPEGLVRTKVLTPPYLTP